MPEGALGRLIELQYGTSTFHLVPSHVVYLEAAVRNTKIHLSTGHTILAEGEINDILLKLRGCT